MEERKKKSRELKRIKTSSSSSVVVVSLEKRRKEKTKKLSCVVKADFRIDNQECEMDCHSLANRGEELSRSSSRRQPQLISNGSSKKKLFKLPKKVLDDCNSMDHASVPRKLRSAMKRNCESTTPILPDSIRLNHALAQDELTKKNGVKKTKHHTKEVSSDVLPNQTGLLGSITKDEEEVAETLFVLAGMFLENEKTKNCKHDDKDCPANAFDDSAVTKEDLNSVCPAKATKADPLKQNVEEHPNLHEIKNFHIESETSKPTSAKNEDADKKLLSKPMNISVFPNLTIDNTNRVKQPIFQGSPLERKPDIPLRARAAESQLPQRLAMNESWKNGLLLQPGSSSIASSHSRILNAPSQAPASKNPPWLEAALSASKPSPLEKDSSNGQDPKLNIAEKPFKRCAAHVYICRLIQNLQMPCKTNTSSAPQPNLLRHNEGSKKHVFTVVNDSDISRNGFNEINYGTGICNLSTGRNLYGDRNEIIQHSRQSQAASSTGAPASYKQSFDFLSLSAGGGSGISPGTCAGSGNGVESRRQFQVPFIQQQTLMSLSTSQKRYNSSPYADQFAAAQQLQLPVQHIGSSLNGMNARAIIHSNDKQLWPASQMAVTQQRSAAIGLNQFPSWQNGRLQDSSTSQQVSIPSLELLKYPRQHQQLTSTGIGFRNGGGALSLQLLYNDHLY
ncbi:hypothetical protein ACFE04_015000 [Oxalis oulophora]